jgi:hypothetical protein
MRESSPSGHGQNLRAPGLADATRLGRSFQLRQRHGERGASSAPVTSGDVTSVGHGDLANQPETETEPAAPRSGASDAPLEDALAIPGRNPPASIANDDSRPALGLLDADPDRPPVAKLRRVREQVLHDLGGRDVIPPTQQPAPMLHDNVASRAARDGSRHCFSHDVTQVDEPWLDESTAAKLEVEDPGDDSIEPPELIAQNAQGRPSGVAGCHGADLAFEDTDVHERRSDRTTQLVTDQSR